MLCPMDASGGAVVAYSPGRVNLIGDHTDYNEGLALPMAIDLGTTVYVEPADTARLLVRSDSEAGSADVAIDVPLDPDLLRRLQPPWARLVAATVAVVRPQCGGWATVTSTVPVGAGLSSSAALEVALALALGFEGPPLALARACQRAEHAATGVPSGLLDQLAVTGAVEGCALLIDFASNTTTTVAVPEDVEILVVHSGVRRALAHTAYAARRAECDAAAFRLGPLGRIEPEAAIALPDAVLRRRARHVVTECDRVRWFAQALEQHDLVEAGRLLRASHRSLAEDFEVSTPELDELVAELSAMPGVYGARLTGAGFGGCVVALSEPGAIDPATLGRPAWRVRPSAAARVVQGSA